jgi:hypothetical protein
MSKPSHPTNRATTGHHSIYLLTGLVFVVVLLAIVSYHLCGILLRFAKQKTQTDARRCVDPSPLPLKLKHEICWSPIPGGLVARPQ